MNLSTYSYSDLREMTQEMGLPIRRSKEKLIEGITESFKEYESYKKNKLDRYERLSQLGEKGKEGTTYLVQDTDGSQYAMKTFRKQKSSTTLRKEAELQGLAAEAGISPRVIDTDTVSKYIVMEKLDRHLYESLKSKGFLSQTHQKQIIGIYKKLDKVGVFHGDANLMNYMFKGRHLYIIDFGMAKEITNGLIHKLGTSTPNLNIMTLGLVLKLKEIGMQKESYSYLAKHLSEEQRSQFKL